MTIRGLAALAAVSLLCGCTALAAETPEAPATTVSKQARERMALLHEKMAACLRSDRAMAECRSEMMRECRSMKRDTDQQACGMGMMRRDDQDKGTPDKSEHARHEH